MWAGIRLTASRQANRIRGTAIYAEI